MGPAAMRFARTRVAGHPDMGARRVAGGHGVTALRFPEEIAVGEIEWEDALEPGGQGHLLAIGVVEVPDGTAVTLEVSDVAEVTVSGRGRAGGWAALAGKRRRAARPGPDGHRVTWQRGMPGGALGNTRSI